MEQFPVLSNELFYQQGAKFNTLSVLAPPYISKMTKNEDTKEFEISGYIPEIWFALQVNNASSYKNCIIRNQYLSNRFQHAMNFTFVVKKPEDGGFGTWTGMIGGVNKGEYDMGEY